MHVTGNNRAGLGPRTFVKTYLCKLESSRHGWCWLAKRLGVTASWLRPGRSGSKPHPGPLIPLANRELELMKQILNNPETIVTVAAPAVKVTRRSLATPPAAMQEPAAARAGPA